MNHDEITALIADLHHETSGGGTHGAYQDVIIDGQVVVSGHRRTQERLDLFGLPADDVNGKTILDLGCNLGQIGGYYSELGALVDGVEINPVFCRWGSRLFPKMRFHCMSIDDLASVDLTRPDIVFLLSAWDYVNQEQLAKLLHSFREPGGTILYFEGHKCDDVNGAPVPRWEQHQIWRDVIENKLGARGLKHLGWLDGGQRPVYKAVL